MIARLHRVWWGLRQESSWGWRELAKGRLRWQIDVVAYRAMSLARVARYYKQHETERFRVLETKSGVTLYYRTNRGDIQGIREIFIDEIYRLPEGVEVTGLVDFGANIGLATVWLATTYKLTGVIAVEPLPENARLLRTNVRANNIACQVIEAAVGTTTGITYFAETSESNLGHVADTGREIPLVDVREIVNELSFSRPLLKMDIEGMEGELLQAIDPVWTRKFVAMVMEMHPGIVNVGELAQIITDQGFDYRDSYEITKGYQRLKRERLFLRREI
ncbi:MAG: FkbM family methyltransferase [Actinomycetes bacterium]